MNPEPNGQHWSSEAGVREDLQLQPHLFMKLAENALTVAESLRNNYFKNTAAFVSSLRQSVRRSASRHDADPVLTIQRVRDAEWLAVQDEMVTFIDGGLGQVQISSQVPILLRVGSYSV